MEYPEDEKTEDRLFMFWLSLIPSAQTWLALDQ